MVYYPKLGNSCGSIDIDREQVTLKNKLQLFKPTPGQEVDESGEVKMQFLNHII